MQCTVNASSPSYCCHAWGPQLCFLIASVAGSTRSLKINIHTNSCQGDSSSCEVSTIDSKRLDVPVPKKHSGLTIKASFGFAASAPDLARLASPVASSHPSSLSTAQISLVRVNSNDADIPQTASVIAHDRKPWPMYKTERDGHQTRLGWK